MMDTKEFAMEMVSMAAKNYTGAVVLAAGNSTRMGKNLNKQLMPVQGAPVLAHTLLAYQLCPVIREIVVVTRPCDFEAVKEIREQYGITKLKHMTSGGATRQESAKKGLAKLSDKVRYVAIADGARCLTTPMQIATVCARAYRFHAASAAHQISDSVKRTNASSMSIENVDRNNLWQAQTPQVFHMSLYLAALSRAQNDGFEGTDDNSLVEHLGYQVRMVECGRENIKITTREDLPLAEAILRYRSEKA